jgi:hypothetical protein
MANEMASNSMVPAYSDWMKTMGGAEKTLSGAAGMFAPGGSYGLGQLAEIQGGAQKAQASGMAGLVASGMSSGSNAVGLKTRIASDATKARLGVNDERMKMYADMLAKLSGLQENKAAGQMGFAQMGQNKTLAQNQMNMEQWLKTTANRGAPDAGAGGGIGGLTPSSGSSYNPWGPTVKGDPNYDLQGAGSVPAFQS